MLDDPELAPELAAKLRLALEVRDFAATELALTVGGNYLDYVPVDREHAVWNVFAAPEFSLEPVTWCYPFAGCAAYRGYFREESALAHADKLAMEGLDVYVGGVDAYSTLGWFDDPLLSTVIDRPDHQLAALIFHELAHQIAYFPDDTTLSESFATVVEMEGLRRWLQARGQSRRFDEAETDARRRQQFVDYVAEFRARFQELYASGLPAPAMRREKADLRRRMRADYSVLKASWGGYGGYDAWFSRSLNNAQLSTVGSYHDLAPQLRQMLRQSGNDLPTFYAEVRELASLTPAQRSLELAAIDLETP